MNNGQADTRGNGASRLDPGNPIPGPDLTETLREEKKLFMLPCSGWRSWQYMPNGFCWSLVTMWHFAYARVGEGKKK